MTGGRRARRVRVDRAMTEGLPQGGRPLGPGDDAAVVAAPDGRVVATTDICWRGGTSAATGPGVRRRPQGGRGRTSRTSPRWALGPTALLVGFGRARRPADASALELDRGLARRVPAGRRVSVVGGDAVRATRSSFGDRARVARRTGAGDSARGRARRRGRGPAAGLGRGRVRGARPRLPLAARRWSRRTAAPQPPYGGGRAARAGATSMVDVSDGLIADLGHIAEASDVHRRALGRAGRPEPLQIVAPRRRGPVRAGRCTGGEDHALVATFPPADVPAGWTVSARSAQRPRTPRCPSDGRRAPWTSKGGWGPLPGVDDDCPPGC